MCLQIPCVPVWVRQPQRAHTESPSLSEKNRAYKSLASFLGEAATARAKSSLQIVPCRFGRISHRTCLQIVRFLFRARNGKVSVFECLQTMYADTSFLPYLVSGPPYREGLGYIIDYMLRQPFIEPVIWFWRTDSDVSSRGRPTTSVRDIERP